MPRKEARGMWQLNIRYKSVQGDGINFEYEDKREETHQSEDEIVLVEIAETHYKKWAKAQKLKWRKWNDLRFSANTWFVFPCYTIFEIKEK